MKDSPQILKYVTNGAIIPFYSNGTLMNILGSFSFFFSDSKRVFSYSKNCNRYFMQALLLHNHFIFNFLLKFKMLDEYYKKFEYLKNGKSVLSEKAFFIIF